MDNEYKREIRELIRKRMLNDQYTNATVKMMVNTYLKDMDEDEKRSPIDNILNEHFDEFMLTLFKIHFKVYDDTQEMLIKQIQQGPPARIIVTTQEHYDKMLKENNDYEKIKKENDGRYNEIKEEVNRYDLVEKENRELYKAIRKENKWS